MGRMEGEARREGVSTVEWLEEVGDEELPSVEEIMEKGKKRGGRKGRMVEEEKSKEDDDSDLLPTLEDDAKEQRDDMRRSLSPSAIEREEDDEDESKEEPVEEAWNLGKLMRVAGVDPSLFGWDDEYEDFLV